MTTMTPMQVLCLEVRRLRSENRELRRELARRDRKLRQLENPKPIVDRILSTVGFERTPPAAPRKPAGLPFVEPPTLIGEIWK